MEKTTKMQFTQDIARIECTIRKKDGVEEMCYILCNENEKYKIQGVNTHDNTRFTLVESEFKTTALKIFAEIINNDIKEFIQMQRI